MTWNLAGSVFPGLHPDWGPALNWGTGIVASLLFFASVLAHELAHSLVAIARGLPVRRKDIMRWLHLQSELAAG